jgi:hypothetical protein
MVSVAELPSIILTPLKRVLDRPKDHFFKLGTRMIDLLEVGSAETTYSLSQMMKIEIQLLRCNAEPA